MKRYKATFLVCNVFLKLDLESDDEKQLELAIRHIENKLGCEFLYKEEAEK